MIGVRLSLFPESRAAIKEAMNRARANGNLNAHNRCRAVLAVADGRRVSDVSAILGFSVETVAGWIRGLMADGISSLVPKKSPGRPSKLSKAEKRELVDAIKAGPQAAGFLAACWRSPMIQDLILKRFRRFYSAHYISQLLRNLGLSFQKARFTSDHHDPEKRKEWLETTWPHILNLAREKNALILFGDEASFPQWGTLTYTWAPRGQQPTVPTCGIRKSYKVLGLIDYFSGRFLAKGHVGRLNSESYEAFLQDIMHATDQHLIIIQDGARYHTSKAMASFFAANSERLTVFQLPSYSPDYNPIEKLWKEIKKEGIHLHYFPTFDSLLRQVDAILGEFKIQPSKVLSLFGLYRELKAAA